MRFLRVHVLADGSKCVYPAGFEAIKFVESGYVTGKDGHWYVLGASEEDAKVDAIVAANPATSVSLSKEDAIAWSEANEIRVEKVTDEAKIRRIELKVAMGKQLTADEMKAIDVDDPASGFGLSQILADKFAGL